MLGNQTADSFIKEGSYSIWHVMQKSIMPLRHVFHMLVQTISKSISLLQSHVQKFQAPGMVGSVSVVEFWLLTLCSLPNWYRSVPAVLIK